jgi:phenylacetate-CoA ligase
MWSASYHVTEETSRFIISTGMTSSLASIPAAECANRQTLVATQSRRLADLLRDIHGRNAFYTSKLDAAGVEIGALDLPRDFAKLPFTTKAELVGDQAANPPWGTMLTDDISRYTRYNQTSSTTGRPLKWPDTNESWQWMLDCWKAVYRGARVGSADRILFAFSFGPFLGFWTAFDAATQIGALCVPVGGMSSQQRLVMIDAVQPTAICCTPTYALRLAEVADQEWRGRPPLSASSVRVVVVAGEPGGSIPSTRGRIEQRWGARVIDHHGLTEVGPVSFECWQQPGFLHLNECEFICEVVDPVTLAPVAEGQAGELVITNLGRTACPVIRYRTGDVVIPRSDPCPCGRTLRRLEGGIVSRTDDMINIRGVNVYPSALESVVHRFTEIAEFRSTVSQGGALRTLSLEIELVPFLEDARTIVSGLSHQLREALALNVPIRVVPAGTLPRFEMKAQRFVVKA